VITQNLVYIQSLKLATYNDNFLDYDVSRSYVKKMVSAVVWLAYESPQVVVWLTRSCYKWLYGDLICHHRGCVVDYIHHQWLFS